jgi:hypothetical protein
MPESAPPAEPRLHRCDLAVCEAMCCYDGVYLGSDEEARLTATVREHAEFFAFLPSAYVVDGTWQDRLRGRKTAVRLHAYRNLAYPSHFRRTRCVFAFADGRCSLQVLATGLGEHPWSRKPRACWLHPLHEGAAGPIPPPVDSTADRDRREPDFPGFAPFTDCGRHRPDGAPWRAVLAEELAYYQATVRSAPDPPAPA